MSETKTFSGFEQAIDHIIESLDDSEIELIKNADPAGLHMALDRWIKKDYVYSDSTNIKDLVSDKVRQEDKQSKNTTDERIDERIIVHPDNISGIIIDGLIKRLQDGST